MNELVRRVALYARVSTAGQDAAPQLVKLREWATRAGYVVHSEHLEVASGKRASRPKMAAIMAAARGHHVHAVAVVKVDRWARSVMHLSSTVHELHGLGVSFVAIDQGLQVEPRNPTSKLILDVLGAVAEWEGSIISERTRDALAILGKGLGPGRHPAACGKTFPCPTGVHPKGIRAPQEAEWQIPPPSANHRLGPRTAQPPEAGS